MFNKTCFIDGSPMKISTHHITFANSLNFFFNIPKQDVLDHPEVYLGSNYRDVLNYWIYCKSLSDEQERVYSKRFWSLDEKTRFKAIDTSKELASEVIDKRYVYCLSSIILELIASHLYNERGIPFTFLPLIQDL